MVPESMIKLTKLNRETFYLNALYVQQIDSTPDTVITLVSGRKMIVLESAEEVCLKITAFYQQVGLAPAFIKGMPSFQPDEIDAE